MQGHMFGHVCVCVCVWCLCVFVLSLSLYCHSALQEELGASQTLQDLDALARRIPQRNSFLPNQELVPPPPPLPFNPPPAQPLPPLLSPCPATSHVYFYFTSVCIVHVPSISSAPLIPSYAPSFPVHSQLCSLIPSYAPSFPVMLPHSQLCPPHLPLTCG